MNNEFSFKSELLAYRQQGKMSRALYAALVRMIHISLRSKGVSSEDVIADVQSAFFEKLLKFKAVFYLKLQLYSEGQTRSFLNMTVSSVLIDYYRREKMDRLSSLDAFECPDNALPETTWNHYKLEAQSIYQPLWHKLSQELQEIFCLVYNGGKNLEEVAQLKSISLGKVHKDKVRISQLIAPEASIEEVAQMVYRLMALHFCCQGKPLAVPH